MSARRARLLPWLILLAVGAMYGVAFALPAADLAVTINGAAAAPWSYSGHQAFSGAWAFRHHVWLANPLFWAAAVLLALRLWVPAATFAVFAFWVAGWELLADRIHGYGNVYYSGYYLWAGSMAALAVAAAAGWWFVPAEYHTRPRDLLRGWRKYPTVLVPAAGLAVLGVLWFDVFAPPRPPSPGVSVGTPKTVAGVTFEVESRPGDNYSASWDDTSYSTSADGRPTVRFDDGVLYVGGVDHGPLAAGDTVRVKADGAVLVNGQPRGPHPVQPRRIDPPAVTLPADEDTFGLAWDPAGARLAAAGQGRGMVNPFRVFDVAKRAAVLDRPQPGLLAGVAWSPDGKRMAVAHRLGRVTLWDPAAAPIGAIEAGNDYVRGAAFVTDDWLAVGRRGKLYAYHLPSAPPRGTPVADLFDEEGVPFAVAGDGKTVVATDRQTVRVLRLSFAGAEARAAEVARIGAAAGAVGVSRDGSLVAAFLPGGRERLAVYDAATAAQRMKVHVRPNQFGVTVQCMALAFTPDNKFLLLEETKTLRVYDLAAGRERAWVAATGDATWVRSIAISPDGATVAAAIGYGGSGPKVKLYKTADLTR